MPSLKSWSRVTPTNPPPDGLTGHLRNASGKANSFLPLLLQFSLSYFYCTFFSVCVQCSVVPDSLRPQGLYSPLGSSVHGIFQARILEWLPFPPPGYLPNPGVKPVSPALAGRFFTTESPGKPRVFSTPCWSVGQWRAEWKQHKPGRCKFKTWPFFLPAMRPWASPSSLSFSPLSLGTSTEY